MLDRLLEYRKSVTISYGGSPEVDLQVRNLSVTEWHAAQLVFDCLLPMMETCVSISLQGFSFSPILFQTT